MLSKILSEAARCGVRLYLDNGNLAYKSSGQDLSEELRSLIVENKRLIVDLLKMQERSSSICGSSIAAENKGSYSHIPASYSQERLWAIDKISGSAHYHIPGVLKLVGVLDVTALNRSLSKILERHESLRTNFVSGDDGRLLQIIRPAEPFVVPIIDMSMNFSDRKVQLDKLTLSETIRPFDLSADLMLRTLLVKVAEDEYIFFVTMHHIAADGWSMAILIEEFNALYGAYTQGQECPLERPPIQYSDYAYWQRNASQERFSNELMGYWVTQLTDLPEVHSLILDHPRPSQQSFVGATFRSQIDMSVVRKLNNFCLAHDGSLFMALYSAFSVLLSRYSNTTDIVVGTPISNREQPEVVSLIGFFVNTLVLRCDLSGNPSFSELMIRNKHLLLDAYAHQQVPFEKIVERLRPARDPSYSPVVQIMLVMQNNEQGTFDLPGLTLSHMELDVTPGIAKYDLTLIVSESDRSLNFDWEYNTDLFEKSTIVQMANHFSSLTNHLLETPDDSVFDVEMLIGDERKKLIAICRGVPTDYPSEKCIHELFEDLAGASPDKIAVTLGQENLTYGDLNRKANQLASYLLNEERIRAEAIVGVYLDRSFEAMIAILAILKVGGAYVPIDIGYPEARIRDIINDSNLVAILTKSHLSQITKIPSVQIVFMDDIYFETKLADQSSSNIRRGDACCSPSDLAYVIYTSGSTGAPKGVMIEHRSVVSLVVNNNYVPLTAETVMLQNAPFSFDAATFEIWGALLNGGRIVIQESPLMEVASLGHFINDNGINTAWMTAGLFDQFASYFYERLPALRYLLVGGDIVSKAAVKQMKSRNESLTIINGYGPTENTTFTCCFQMTDEICNVPSIPIGKSIGNCTSYVLDSSLNLTPQNLVGELYVSGVGLARGYLNCPDLTAERFIANPFYGEDSPLDSKRLYRTGDIVRRLVDGNLEFLGRIDNQIKIRGFRVELAEIENALREHESVKNVLVVATDSTSIERDKRIVAYVATDAVRHDRADVEANEDVVEDLRKHLTRILPEYMHPSAFILLKKLPLTLNGKVDRRALAEPEMPFSESIYVAPRNETEKVLCLIWQEVLDVERVGVNVDFFHLGGHSLLLIKMLGTVNLRLKTNFSVGDFFQHDTIMLMANKIGH